MNRTTIPNLDPNRSPTRRSLINTSSPTRTNGSPIRNSGSPERRQQISEMEQQGKSHQEGSKKRGREPAVAECSKRVHFNEKVLEVDTRSASPLKESKEVFWQKLDNIESMLLQMNERLFDIHKLQEKIYAKLDNADPEVVKQVEQLGKSIDKTLKKV